MKPSFAALSGMTVITLAWGVLGSGHSEQKAGLVGKALTRQVLQLEQGASVVGVKEQLGEPARETNRAETVGLSYGIWQVTFVNDRLRTRSKVIIPQGGRLSEDRRVSSKEILRLSLGAKIRAVEARLGSPEVVYIIFEGQPQPIKILRYGAWELTFSHGKLSNRAQ